MAKPSKCLTLRWSIMIVIVIVFLTTLLPLSRRRAEQFTASSKPHFLTFGEGECFSKYARALADQARTLGGFGASVALDMKYVDPFFIKQNEQIFASKRGNGYWLWKPFIIFKYLLQNVGNGDVVVYVDSLYRFKPRGATLSFATWITKQLDSEKCDILLMKFKPEPNRWEYQERQWCKRDAYVVLDADVEAYKNTTQVWGGFFAIRKSVQSMAFLASWLAYCQDIRAITDATNALGKPEDPALIEHRHDQSILSLLAKKHGLKFTDFPEGYMVDLRHAHEGSC